MRCQLGRPHNPKLANDLEGLVFPRVSHSHRAYKTSGVMHNLRQEGLCGTREDPRVRAATMRLRKNSTSPSIAAEQNAVLPAPVPGRKGVLHAPIRC